MGKALDIINISKQQNWEVCIYGLGQVAKACGLEILSELGLHLDYICDRNPKTTAWWKGKDVNVISLDKLLSFSRDILVFIALGDLACISAEKELSKNKCLHIVTIPQIAKDEDFLLHFFRLETFPIKKIILKNSSSIEPDDDTTNHKIAVYTCITGNYDTAPSIKSKSSDCDYFLLTDDVEKYKTDSQFMVRCVNDYIGEKSLSAKDVNRYCKSHGFELFPNYRYSLYFDGNIDIVGDVKKYIEYLGTKGLAFHRHPSSEDAYHELFRVYAAGRITREEALHTATWLSEEGCPRRLLCLDCNVIFSDHSNSKAREFLDKWYQLYMRGTAKRDQIYMTYLIWKENVDVGEIGIIPKSVDGDDGCVKRRYFHKIVMPEKIQDIQ